MKQCCVGLLCNQFIKGFSISINLAFGNLNKWTNTRMWKTFFTMFGVKLM